MTDSQFASSVMLAVVIVATAAGYGFARATQTTPKECLVEVRRTPHESHIWLRPCKEILK